MKKILVINLLCLFSMSAHASYANVRILIKSGLSDVVVTAKSEPFIFPAETTGLDFSIGGVFVKTSELHVKPAMAAGKMKKSQFLNVEEYPEIIVSHLVCSQLSRACKLNLKIKGIEKSMVANLVGDGRTAKIRFSMLLSQFNIAQKISLWSIENKALVDVDIVK